MTILRARRLGQALICLVVAASIPLPVAHADNSRFNKSVVADV